ncbi:MAG: TIGR04255 family protein [Faecousia sp.]
MFSSKERVIYRNNQLGEVICQLRFPEILRISADPPAAFQEEIRDVYPQYTARRETPAPRISGTPGKLVLENQPSSPNYQFASEDNLWRVNLTSKFISLACGKYTCWEDFASRLDKPLAAFIKTYHPAYFERVGLRYLNFLSRASLGTDAPWRDLVSPCYLGPMAEEDVGANAFSQCNLDTELAIRAGCRVKIHAGTGFVKKADKQDPEQKFIFDMDLFMPGKVPVNYSAGALATLHSQAFPIFRDAITELTHNAMEPKDL